MEKISLHPSLPPFSRIVYGAWRIADDKDTSASHIKRKISACLEQGITTFDHADIYGNYSCEALFGSVWKDLQAAEAQHISKCNIMLKSDKFPTRRVKHYDMSAQHITQSVENSLRNLHIEALDVLLIHRPSPLMDADETGAALDTLIQAGKIKAAGVSNFMPADFDLLQSRMKNPLVTNQIEMSVLHRNAWFDGTLSHLYKNRLKPMAWSPLAGGQLFNPAHKKVLDTLGHYGQKWGVSADAVAVQFLLHHPAKILPIMGTNNVDRIAAISDAFRVQLSTEDWFDIWSAAQGEPVP